MGRIILNNEEYTGSSGSAPVTDVTVNGSSVVNNGVAEITEVDDVGLTSTLELGTSTADGALDGQLELWGGTPLFRGKATLKAHHAQTGDLTFELPATSGMLARKSDIPTKTSDLTNDSDFVSDNPTFTEASTRANIASGESFATILGKIKKFFTDLKAVAFSGSYNDLSDKPTIPVGSDYVQKSGDTMTGLLKFSTDGFRTYQDWGYDIGDSGNFHHLRNAQWDNWQIQKYDNTEALTYTFERGELTNYGDVIINHKDGTASATGTTVLSLGNNIAEGTDKNSKGLLRIYSNTAKKTEITAPSLTADRTLSLPDKSGTVALTSDIPTNNNQLTNGAGYITDSDVTKLHPYAGRPASANTQFGDGTCRYFLASSSMSTGKPSGDAHILHMSWDNANGWDAQLALVNGAERELQYRQQTSGTWGDWKTVRNTVRYRFQTGGSVNGTWYKMFQIAYSSYNVCTLRMIVKVGYMPMCEVDACIRFAPSGVSSSASSYIIKNLGGGVYDGGIRVKMFLVSTNTVGFAVQPFGSASDYGFEILDISSESQAIGVNQISVSSPFEQLPSEPTSFGVQIEEIISKNGHTTINELEAEDYLQIYSTSFAKSVFLKAPSTISTDRQISLPNKDGTIALTSDISSRRYKENIIPLSEDEAKKILDVEIVNYDYKENVVDEDERYDQKGAIAEDVVNIIPNAVTYADVDGEQLPDGINYTKFIPYLIKMVQIQQKEIDELKAMIKEKS